MSVCSRRHTHHVSWVLLLLVLPRFASAGLSPRSRRSLCQEGNYTVEGRTCCRCGAGQALVKHCEVTAGDRVCRHCKDGTYNSHANAEFTCERCTSCSQPNANLEVKDLCTIGKDTVCGCLKGHYCGSPACNFCDPCDTCEETAIKTPCKGTNNTVCQEKNKELGTLSVAGLVIGVLLIVFVALGVLVCWKKRFLCFRPPSRDVERDAVNGNAQEMEELLQDLSPHASAVAEAVGWKEMRDIALATGTTNVAIENCRKDHPGDTQEQTVQLLLLWVEAQGSKASRVLVEKLREHQKTAMKEVVLRIIRKDG